MKGIFHAGPTIDPLFQTYLTVPYSQRLVVGDEQMANSHWSYATSIKSRVIVILMPLMPLYNLERSPPYVGAKGM